MTRLFFRSGALSVANDRQGIWHQSLSHTTPIKNVRGSLIEEGGSLQFPSFMKIWFETTTTFCFLSIKSHKSSILGCEKRFSSRLALFCCCVAANWNHCSLRVHKVACFYGWRRWVSRGIRPSIQSSYGSILGAGGERGDIYLGLANRGHHHRHLPFLLR